MLTGLFGIGPRLVLAAAIVLNLLAFVRIAVLYAPELSYLAPTGADRVFYYAYARSLVIDRDLDFTNEIALRPPSSGLQLLNGRPTNKYPIGAPVLALPAFALTHAAIVLGNSAGLVHMTPDGYSPPYALAYVLSQMAWTLFGMYLVYRAASAYLPEPMAAWGTVAAWLSTCAFRFTAVDLMMSHSAAMFSVAWCSYETVALVKAPERRTRWLRLGASSAFLILVRYQDGVYLLVPASAVLAIILRDFRTRGRVPAVGHLLAAALGFALMFAPQLFTWHHLYGSWMPNTYGDEGLGAGSWLRPHLLGAFWDRGSGLRTWLLAIVIGLTGCFSLAAARRDPIPAAAAVAWLINLYVTATMPYWTGNVIRSGFDVFFPLALGFGVVIWRGQLRAPRLTGAVIALLILWSLPFAATPRAPIIAPESSYLAGWLSCVSSLL